MASTILKIAKPILFVASVLFFATVPIYPSSATTLEETEAEEVTQSMTSIRIRIETQWNILEELHSSEVFAELDTAAIQWNNLQDFVSNTANLSDMLVPVANAFESVADSYQDIANLAWQIEYDKEGVLDSMDAYLAESISEKNIIVAQKADYEIERNNIVAALILAPDSTQLHILQNDLAALDSRLASKTQSIARWDEFIALTENIISAMVAYDGNLDVLLNAINNSVGVYRDAAESVRLASELYDFEQSMSSLNGLFDVSVTTGNILAGWGQVNDLVNLLGSI